MIMAWICAEAGAEIGQTSGLKLCYSAFTKGTAALVLELMIAAEGRVVGCAGRRMGNESGRSLCRFSKGLAVGAD